MRRTPILLIIAVAALLAACGSSTAPGWTYAPPTPPPSAAPSASGEASAPPASEAPSGEDGVVTLTAQGTKWVETELQAPAGTPITLHLDNQDNGMPHDVVIKDSAGAEVVRSEIITGIAAIDVPVPALAAGSYPYVCSIHPTMVGTLTVGE